MKNLRRDFERFCYRHQNMGIPNLMLYLVLGTAVVYFFMQIDPSNYLYFALNFNRNAILHGQVWRLLTYILIPTDGNLLLLAISLYFYYWIGGMLENAWGTFRFNLFYLSGVLLMDAAALIFGANASVTYLNLSLFLAFATLYPENQVLLFFIIPIKMKYLAWFYFAVTLFQLIGGDFFPLFALLNYFLFFGSDILNVLPDFLRPRRGGAGETLRQLWREAEAQSQLGQGLHPEKAAVRPRLPPQVHRLRPHRRQQPGAGVPLLLQMHRLPLLLPGPHQRPSPHPIKFFTNF